MALQILTQHCTFCNHLLLATTHDLSKLPRRSGESQDKAIILPLADSETAEETKNKHVALLLSTTIPDRRATMIRREDGIEKRILLRCGRCRVVMGYHLDGVHYEGGASEEQGYPAVYILPGAVVQTEKMGEGMDEREWRGWNEDEGR